MAISETWKPIRGYEGIYEVSDKGNVRGMDRVVIRSGFPMNIRGKEMSQIKMPNGYMTVGLRASGTQKRIYVHRAVAEAFIDNVDGLPEVNHKDENKSNNCVSNLEWVTRGQNLKHNGGSSRRVANRRKPVFVHGVGTFDSLTSAAKALGCKTTDVSRCCHHVKGRTRLHGFRVMFLSEYNSMAPIVDPPATTEVEGGEAE